MSIEYNSVETEYVCTEIAKILGVEPTSPSETIAAVRDSVATLKEKTQ